MADITPYFRFAGSSRGQKTLLSVAKKKTQKKQQQQEKKNSAAFSVSTFLAL